MTGFKLHISGVGSDCSTNCTTATAQPISSLLCKGLIVLNIQLEISCPDCNFCKIGRLHVEQTLFLPFRAIS